MRVRQIATRSASAAIRELSSRLARQAGPAVRITRQQVPYWQERGWRKDGAVYTGSFQTPYGAFTGHIVEELGEPISFFLYQPTAEVRHHSHFVCFQHRGNDWYLIHMGREPKDVSSGILTIERLLTEAYEA